MHTGEPFTPPPDTDATGDVMQANTKVWLHVQVMVELCAEELAPTDRERQVELIQEARVVLWRMDASRCDIRSLEDLKVLRTMLGTAMGKEAKRLRRQDKERGEGVPEDLVKRLS